MNAIDILDKIKNYNRPIRMVIWVIIISFSYIFLILGNNKNNIDPLTEVMLLGMFTDLGIYTVARTTEKNTQAKIDGTKSVTQTITDAASTATTDNQ